MTNGGMTNVGMTNVAITNEQYTVQMYLPPLGSHYTTSSLTSSTATRKPRY